MRRTWIPLAAAAALAAWAALPAPEAMASQPIADDTGLACTACHDKPGSKLLTGRGKFFELMGTVEQYDALAAEYGDCTACHARKPGSTRLTARGREAKERLGDMAGVCRELREHPPVAKPAEPAGQPPTAGGAGQGG